MDSAPEELTSVLDISRQLKCHPSRIYEAILRREIIPDYVCSRQYMFKLNRVQEIEKFLKTPKPRREKAWPRYVQGPNLTPRVRVPIP